MLPWLWAVMASPSPTTDVASAGGGLSNGSITRVTERSTTIALPSEAALKRCDPSRLR